MWYNKYICIPLSAVFLKTEMAMKIKEETLSADIRAGRLSRVYLIYGKEPFLVSMYTDRIIKKIVGEDALDFYLQRLDECPDAELLSDYAEALPVFAEVKVITVKASRLFTSRSHNYDHLLQSHLLSFFPEAYRQFINTWYCSLHDKNPIVLPIIISISY